MSETESCDESVGKFSPLAGCSMFIIAGVLVLGMIAFATWSYFKVKNTISGFTQEEPKKIELVETQGKEAAQIALNTKLTDFTHRIEAHQLGELSLNADELNLAIATYPILKPHRKNLFITSIDQDGIHAQIAYPIKAQLGSDAMRYLNGNLTLVPELVEGAPFPRITQIKADQGGEIPEAFLKFISETLLHPFLDDSEMSPLFHSLSSVEMKGDTLILKTDSAHAAAVVSQKTEKAPDRELVISRIMKGFALVALAVLAIVSILLMISRRKAKKS